MLYMGRYQQLNIFLSLMASLLLFTSCSARVNGSLHEDGSADASLRVSLEPRTAALIRSLSRLNKAAGPSDQILDGPRIAASMASAPGLTAVFFKNINPTTIEGAISIGRVEAFLAIPGQQGGSPFIRYEHAGSGGSLKMSLDRQSGPRIITLLSPTAADYLAALMAPVITKEALSKGKYLEVVQSVYGKGVADEIAGAQIQVSLEVPRPISEIKGGTVSGTAKNRGEFVVPLLDMLVLERPLEYEISWK